MDGDDVRKRTVSVGDSRVKPDPDAPPLKKQALSESQQAGGEAENKPPLLQEEVEHFQKEAIFRQMQWYKREATLAQERVGELSKQVVFHDSHLRIVSAWWDQLLDEMKVIVGDLTSNFTPSILPTSLLTGDNDQFKLHLAEKQSKIKDTVVALLANVSSSTETGVESFKGTITKLAEDLKIAQVENALLKEQSEDWERRMADATIRFMSAEKKLDRFKSATLAKIEKHAQSQRPEENLETKPEQRAVPVDPAANIEVNEEMKAILEKRGDDIQKLEQENARLCAELVEQSGKMLTSESVTTSEPFLVLQSQHNNTFQLLENARGRADVLEQELTRLRDAQEEFRSQLLAETKNNADEISSQIVKIEQDLTRVRAVRDELHQDQQIRKAKESERLKAVKQIEELAEVRSSRIKSLESEIARIKAENLSTTEEAAASSESQEELVRSIDRLRKQNQSLMAELPSMEAAFNKAHALATSKVNDLSEIEKRLVKLVADKTKADQKYFAAMKSKETLQQENKHLKQQVNRSSEVISSLREAEKTVESKVANMAKQVQEWRSHYEKALAKSKADEAKVETAAIQCDAAQRQASQLNALMLRKVQSEEAARKAQRVAEEELQKVNVQLKNKMASISNGTSEEMQSLLNIAKCSSCRNNWKNTALKSCGHVFCKECVEERIASRSRKCPVCARSFSSGEVMPVHL